jgi:hypothetical protein
MKAVIYRLSALNRMLFVALILGSFALISCEGESVTPKDHPNTFAGDDPPKDTDPVKPPSGGSGG